MEPSESSCSASTLGRKNSRTADLAPKEQEPDDERSDDGGPAEREAEPTDIATRVTRTHARRANLIHQASSSRSRARQPGVKTLIFMLTFKLTFMITCTYDLLYCSQPFPPIYNSHHSVALTPTSFVYAYVYVDASVLRVCSRLHACLRLCVVFRVFLILFHPFMIRIIVLRLRSHF